MNYLLDQMPFLQQYWSYILAGFCCYICARFMVVKIYYSKNVNAEFPINAPEDSDNEDSEKDSGLDNAHTPALPSDLEHVLLSYERIPVEETVDRAAEFYNFMNLRRTVRHFSTDSVPAEVIRNIVKTAGTAPSGAHTEPWTFIVISNKDLKQQIREIIEAEEETNYNKRMGKKWTTDLQPLRTNWVKEYLTDAPYLILVFKQMYSVRNGVKVFHYYNEMSVSLAAGMLLTAIHYAGLVSLTSTPLNCGPALRKLLDRPSSEKLTLLLPVGYPAERCLVPDLQRKEIDEYLIEFD